MEIPSSLKYKLSNKIPLNDRMAYQRYPSYQKYYSRFNVLKYQGIKVGRLNETPSFFPVFLKPDVNLFGANKNCFVVKNYQELENIRNKFKFNKKEYENLFWSEFINGFEGSWDLILYKGNIIFKSHYLIHHVNSGDPTEFLEDYKELGEERPFPENFKLFIERHFSQHTGILNLQYRKNVIIELGFRFDGGGRFLIQHQDKDLINQINSFFDNPRPMTFNKVPKSFVFKVSVKPPIIFMPPVFLISHKLNSEIRFHHYLEYGKEKKAYLNIYTKTIEEGRKLQIEMEEFYYLYNFVVISFLIYLFTRFSKHYLLLFGLILYLRYGTIESRFYSRL
jgi:hypothetical protein